MRRSMEALVLGGATCVVAACGGEGGVPVGGALDEMTVEAYASETQGALSACFGFCLAE